MHNNRKITPHIKASKLNDIKSTKPKMISLKADTKNLKNTTQKKAKNTSKQLSTVCCQQFLPANL
jgi:hypothetical protein